MSDTLAEVRALLVTHFELDADEVVSTARLREDLDLDSLDALEMIKHIERSVGRAVDPEVLADVPTVGAVVELVERLRSGQ